MKATQSLIKDNLKLLHLASLLAVACALSESGIFHLAPCTTGNQLYRQNVGRKNWNRTRSSDDFSFAENSAKFCEFPHGYVLDTGGL